MNNYNIINGDMLSEVYNLKPKSVDFILVDPPYGTTKCSWDSIIPFNEMWKCFHYAIKDNGAIAVFGQGTFYVDLVNSNHKLFRYDLVWDKQLTSGFLNAKRMPLRQHEQIAVFYKKLPTYNPQFTQGKPLHSKGVSYKNKEHKNQNYGEFHMTDDSRAGSTEKYPTSILSFSKPHPSIAKHRTEKPIDLLRYLIRTYTNDGELVLDNCMGSGSTIVAALLENRKAIGIELDKHYFEIAKKRIEDYDNKQRTNIFSIC